MTASSLVSPTTIKRLLPVSEVTVVSGGVLPKRALAWSR